MIRTLMLRRTIPLHALLLLVVWFNALVGTPLHETRHLREALHGITTAAAPAGIGQAAKAHAVAELEAGGEAESGTEEVHATCTWCLTHALDAPLATITPPAPRLSADVLVLGPPGDAAPFTASRVRWPFASRAPPSFTAAA